jgi:HPt (histidine-containing phosphotransfer) domain-containing protein
MLKKLGKQMSGLFASHPDAGTGNLQTLAAAPGGHEDERQLDAISRNFSREIFAQLLIELPAHRHAMGAAFAADDHPRLRDCVHQLLGAAAYCDAPELEDGLRTLHRALKTEPVQGIEHHFHHAMGLIDSTLDSSGYSGS